MNLQEIIVKDFLSYRKEKLELPTDDIYLIVGENFTGKSNLIIDALTWGLFGVSRYKGDYIIREGAEEAEVTIVFVLDNVEHIIIKSKGRKGTVKVRCDNYKGSSTETQEYIRELLGLDYNTFSNSACLAQGKLESFAKLSPKEAKELVISILQLGIYADYAQVAKQKLDTNKLDLVTYKARLETLGDETTQIKDLETKIDELKKKKVEQEKPLAEFNNQLVEQEEIKDKFVREAKKLDDKIYKIKLDQLSPINAEVEILKKNSTSISGLPNNCPTCKQEVTEIYKTGVVEEYKKQLSSKTVEYNKIVAEIQAIEKLEREATEKADKEATKSIEISNKIRSIELEISNTVQDIQFTTGKLQGLEKTKKVAEESKTKIMELSGKTATYQELYTAFGRDGIPSYIIENSKLELEKTTNDLLKYMEISLSVELIVQKELQKGGFSDTLEILITKDGIAKPFQCYSGAERTLVSIALRVALSIILSRRSGSKMQTLILDEPTIFLSQENMRNFIRGIKYVYEVYSFRKIIIITHSDFLKGSFSNNIEVTVDGGISHIVR